MRTEILLNKLNGIDGVGEVIFAVFGLRTIFWLADDFFYYLVSFDVFIHNNVVICT